MKLVSLTLTGNNADIIGDAIKSVVNWVDYCIVIDTGVTDNSLEIAKSIAQDKYIKRKFNWINNFAAARNFALEVATQLQADWAIIVDTDERIHLQIPNFRETLDTLVGDVFFVSEINNSYSKERLFKIPNPGKYIGATHEYFDLEQGVCRSLSGMAFSELPKSVEVKQAKYQRDLTILNKLVENHPYNSRWLFYLGETYKNLGYYNPAITAYHNCANVSLWDEEAAWASYREAECWLAQCFYQEAISACTRGLAKHSGIAELAWLAGYASYYAGSFSQAIYWANLSITLGKYQGCGKEIYRIGFQYPEAQYEKPYDILRYAYAQVGKWEKAKLAEQFYQQAYLARINDTAENRLNESNSNSFSFSHKG